MSPTEESDEPDERGSIVEHEDGGGEDTTSVIRRLEASFTAFRRSGPAFHPIFDRFQAEHVTQFLEHSRDRERDDYQLKRGGRWFRLAYALCGIGLFVFLTVILMPRHSDLYFKLLQGVGLFVAGVAGGYGLKTYRDRQQE